MFQKAYKPVFHDGVYSLLDSVVVASHVSLLILSTGQDDILGNTAPMDSRLGTIHLLTPRSGDFGPLEDWDFSFAVAFEVDGSDQRREKMRYLSIVTTLQMRWDTVFE